MEGKTVTHDTAQLDSYVWYDKTILIVEDIELNFRYIKELLNPTGAALLRAVHGQEAVDICEANPTIDIVLMDIFMPVMNGYEATRRIKAMRPDLPVIAQTAYAYSEEFKLAMEAGCSDFVSKPLEKITLFRKIDRFFQPNNK